MKALYAADRLNINVPTEVKDYITEYLPLWSNIWRGNPPWKSVHSNHIKNPRMRDLLCAAQTLCTFIAKVDMTEFTVHVNNEDGRKVLNDILAKSSFKERMRDADERKEALGSVAIKLHIQNNQIKYDFISGGNFIPLAWNNQEITDALFLSNHVRGDLHYTQIERQYISGVNEITIEQYLFKSNNKRNLGEQVGLRELADFGLIEKTKLNISGLLFVYVKPAVSNRHVPMGCPLGTSRLDGSELILKAVDIAFDELQIERMMAEKMIFVSQFMLDNAIDVKGIPRVKINKDTRMYQILSIESKDGQMPEVFDPNFRIEEHRLDLQTQLDLLCIKLGVDAGTMSFDGNNGVKTAEEVRSRNSKTYQTIVDNQKIWKEQLERLFYLTFQLMSIFRLSGFNQKISQDEIKVDFDDAVTPDRKTYINEGMSLFNAGIISQKTFLVDYLGYSAERAEEEIARCNGHVNEGLSLYNSGAVTQKTFLTDYMNYSPERADEEVARCQNGQFKR